MQGNGDYWCSREPLFPPPRGGQGLKSRRWPSNGGVDGDEDKGLFVTGVDWGTRKPNGGRTWAWQGNKSADGEIVNYLQEDEWDWLLRRWLWVKEAEQTSFKPCSKATGRHTTSREIRDRYHTQLQIRQHTKSSGRWKGDDDPADLLRRSVIQTDHFSWDSKWDYYSRKFNNNNNPQKSGLVEPGIGRRAQETPKRWLSFFPSTPWITSGHSWQVSPAWPDTLTEAAPAYSRPNVAVLVDDLRHCSRSGPLKERVCTYLSMP